MAGLLNKFLDYIGIEETDEEDEYMEDLYEEDSRDADNVVSIGNRGRSGKRQRRQPPIGGAAEDDRLPSHQL